MNCDLDTAVNRQLSYCLLAFHWVSFCIIVTYWCRGCEQSQFRNSRCITWTDCKACSIWIEIACEDGRLFLQCSLLCLRRTHSHLVVHLRPSCTWPSCAWLKVCPPYSPLLWRGMSPACSPSLSSSSLSWEEFSLALWLDTALLGLEWYHQFHILCY